MRKYKKTYAIMNLTEKHTVFHLGKTKVHVSFTGGIVTKRGVTPATFTTEDPIVQFAIEQSADFKKGVIWIRSKYPMEGEVKIGKNEPEAPEPSLQSGHDGGVADAEEPSLQSGHDGARAAEAAPGKREMEAGGGCTLPAAGDQGAGAEQDRTEEIATGAGSDMATEAEAEVAGAGAVDEPSLLSGHDGASAAEAAPGKREMEDAAGDGLEVIEVSCKDVAKQYLQEHYGERPAPLRTIADVQECAAKYGITFVFV